jgi:CRP/FNR family transcriptional regulator, nitrogen oxide reductase regulator
MEMMLPTAEVRMALQSGVPLFDGLPTEGFEVVTSLARDRKCARNETLYRQGDSADAFHLIVAGRLKVSKTSEDGQQIIVRYLGAREVAGCVAVCGGIPYPATTTAAEDSWLLTWSRAHISELATRYPDLAFNVMRIMGRRTVELQDRLQELQSDCVEGRLAHTLTRLALQAGRRTAEGVEIDFPISRQDLAEMTGTTLHTVSRMLSAWETKGIVAGGRQKVVILRPHELVAIGEGLPDRPV